MDGCLQAAVLFVYVQPVFAAKIGRKYESCSLWILLPHKKDMDLENADTAEAADMLI